MVVVFGHVTQLIGRFFRGVAKIEKSCPGVKTTIDDSPCLSKKPLVLFLQIAWFLTEKKPFECLI